MTLINQARRIYFKHITSFCQENEPFGVVLKEGNGEGRVVYHPPVLLPEELFIEIGLLRQKQKTLSRSKAKKP
ncbi:hypothetical protein [Prochlorococcus sp. MIT 1341]|uniref:hypothetical protein n=1 Tax=Prochlorococcus sp. MIT 1341 TaxID=3096221 RepID=UPI002A7584D9|nr:hypothetical protein [Prochlorococcus sp. MIT 1341]